MSELEEKLTIAKGAMRHLARDTKEQARRLSASQLQRAEALVEAIEMEWQEVQQALCEAVEKSMLPEHTGQEGRPE
jgi:hypothetical protein